MKYPHSWLARLARVGMVLGLAAGMATAGAILLPPRAGVPWYPARQLATWQAVTTPGQVWAVGSDQVEDLAVVLVAPSCWVLAAGLLRLAATGRLVACGAMRAGRWLAVAGILVGVVVTGLGVTRWVYPTGFAGSEPLDLASRVRLAVADGRNYQIQLERIPTDGSRRVGWSRSGPSVNESDTVRRITLMLCSESCGLFSAVRAGGVLFFLSGVVYCLGRSGPDDET